MAACSRDTPSSSTRKSARSPRPRVDRSPLSLYISPKLGPEMTTRYALGAVFSRGTGEMDGDLLRVVSSIARAILVDVNRTGGVGIDLRTASTGGQARGAPFS